MPDESEAPGQKTLYHVVLSPTDRVYVTCVSIFVTLLVLTNIIGPKLFKPPFFEKDFFGSDIGLTAGILTYPLTFLVTDVVSEVFGKKRADRMVFLGFLMSLLMLGIVQLSILVEHEDVERIARDRWDA